MESKNLNHQVLGVTRTIRQSPDVSGGAHVNNENLDVDPGDWGIGFMYAHEEMEDAIFCDALDGNTLGVHVD